MGLLSKLLVPGQVGGTKKSSLVIDGEDVAITLRRNRNARRFILRLDKRGDGVVVTLPTDGSERQAMEFAASNALWIRRQLSASTDAIQFVKTCKEQGIVVLGIEGFKIFGQHIQPFQEHSLDFENDIKDSHETTVKFLEDRKDTELWFEIVSEER